MESAIAFISSQVKPGKLKKFAAQRRSAFTIILVDGKNTEKFGEVNVRGIQSYKERVNRDNDYAQIAMQWMDEWNRRTQLYKRVMYEGFSLWWFERFGFYRWLQGVLSDIDAIRQLIDETKPDQIFLLGIDSYWQDIIQCVASQGNIAVEALGKKDMLAPLFASVYRLIRFVGRAVPILIVVALRTTQGTVRIARSKLETRGQNRTRVLMFTDSTSWQRVKTNESGKASYFDVHLGLVLKTLLAREVKVVAFDVMGSFQNGLRTFLQKKYPYVPLEGYQVPYKVRTLTRPREEQKAAGDLWEHIRNDTYLRQGNFYEGIDVSVIVLNRLHLFITKKIPSLITTIELGKFILRSEKPDAIVIKSEYFFPGQNLIAASKVLRIPVIGVQHGIIHERHIGYVYPRDIDVRTIPLPDKMAVFGDYYREILTKESIYTESQVEVTGQSRLDFLSKRPEQTQDTTLPHLPRDKRIMLFTSQPPIEQMAASLLMEGLSQLGDDYFLVIKLHPGESEDLAEPYYQAAREYKVENFMVVKQVDLYGLLVLCDLHISVASTVLSEAVVFGKPNLIITTPGSVDAGRWREQGVALYISDFVNFREAVETVLGDKETADGFHKAREGYVQRHYYRMDGRASERICNLIVSQVRGE